jgi:hypothetical protein
MVPVFISKLADARLGEKSEVRHEERDVHARETNAQRQGRQKRRATL